MANKHLFVSILFLLFVLVAPFPKVANALSTGTGNLSLKAGITYETGSLEWFRGPSTLETWTIAQIISYPEAGGGDYHYHEMDDAYGDASIPGWDKELLPLSGAYNDNKVEITNNHTDAMRPSGQSSVDFSSSGFSSVKSSQTYASIMYFANLHALQDGSFTFYVDYDGSWDGSTTNTNDWVSLLGSLQVSVQKMNYDEDSFVDWGTRVGYEREQQSLRLDEIGSIGIDDFTGQLSLTVDYTAGDRFYLRFDSANAVSGYSEDLVSAPVPEPSTILLLGSGLLGLGWYGRKRKKS